MLVRWTEWSEDHVAAHNVTWDEVVQACEPPTVSRPGNRPGRLRVLGQTHSGRYLVVVVAPDEDAPTVFVVTAFDMDERERRIYRARARKG